jgi:hypothetical protein
MLTPSSGWKGKTSTKEVVAIYEEERRTKRIKGNCGRLYDP